MCGICGVIATDGRLTIPENAPERMIGVLSHRGPDEFGAWRDETVRKGLFSPHAEVRRAAAVLGATRPFPRVVHHMIDAANADTQLVPHAARSVGMQRDYRGVRWLIDRAASGDELMWNTGRWSIYSVGPPARSRLMERAKDSDPQVRRFVTECLLSIAGPDDLSTLHRWVDEASAEDAALTDSVIKAIAAIEAGSWRPSPPEPVQFEQR